jgi:hypothetical protein
MKTKSNAALNAKQKDELLKFLKARFEQNMARHQGLDWAKVQAKLDANPAKLWSLSEMERTGGEPDVVGHDQKTGEYIFYDCSAESPQDRRTIPSIAEAGEVRYQDLKLGTDTRGDQKTRRRPLL